MMNELEKVGMEYSILDPSGKVVATASSACEARTKFRAGRCVFGQQAIHDKNGVAISEEELESLCADEAAAEHGTA